VLQPPKPLPTCYDFCQQPFHPDQLQIWCEKCSIWAHLGCLKYKGKVTEAQEGEVQKRWAIPEGSKASEDVKVAASSSIMRGSYWGALGNKDDVIALRNVIIEQQDKEFVEGWDIKDGKPKFPWFSRLITFRDDVGVDMEEDDVQETDADWQRIRSGPQWISHKDKVICHQCDSVL
jgi:hypothetical protein